MGKIKKLKMEENKEEKGPAALANIIELILSSPSHGEMKEAVDRLLHFHEIKENVNDDTTDVLLNNLICVAVEKPSEGVSRAASHLLPNFALALGWKSLEERQQELMKLVDSLCFGGVISASMFEIVLARSLHLEDKKAEGKILPYLAQRFYRQRNVPKFIDHLLKAAQKDCSALKGRLNPSMADCLGDWVAKMPISQNISMWAPLCQALKEDADLFEKDSAGTFPRTGMAADILAVLLLNICLADYSIRDETINDVIKSLSLVTSRLETLSSLAVKQPEVFLRPLLSLAFAYGELHHFLSLYSLPYVELQPPKPTEQQKVQKEDESIYDMSFFHSYATRDQWVTLGQLGEEPDLLPIVTPFWGPLILQRIRHLVVFAGRNKQDKTVRKLVGWLVDRHDSGLEHLLVDNFKYLLAFIGPRQLETLGQKFITSEVWRKGPLQDPDLADKRSFQMTVICAVFRAIHDQSRKRKEPDAGETLLPVGTQTVLKMLSLQADIWIGSLDRSSKEVTGWLRQSADIIKKAMLDGSSVPSTDLTELLQPLELIGQLPLEYLAGPAHSAALMGILSLLITLNPVAGKDDASKERLWMMLIRLLDNQEKLSSLYEYFPSAELLTWSVSTCRTLPANLSSLVFSTLFDEVLRSPQGLKDASTWIESTDLTSASLTVAVLAMKKLVGNEKPAAVQMLKPLKQHFLKSFEAALEEDQPIIDVLHGAICLLQVYVDQKRATGTKKTVDTSKSENEEENALELKPLLDKLDQLVDVCKKGIISEEIGEVGSTSGDFLHFVFMNQKQLAGHLSAHARVSVWTAYQRSPQPTRWEDRLLRQLLAKANKKELTLMVNGILDDLQTVSIKASQEDVAAEDAGRDVQRICSFFRHLVMADLPTQDDRHGIRIQAVQTALPLFQHIIFFQCRRKDKPTFYEDVVRLALPAMSVYLSILNLGSSYAYPHDVASALHVSLALPLEGSAVLAMSAEHFEAVFTSAYKVLHYLLVKHEEIAADRIPVLFQVYRRLLVSTCARADQRRFGIDDATSNSEIVGLTDCANRLSRLASVINGQKLRYRRTATYLVADFMDEFKKQPVHPAVKQELTTALHHLMDLLDQHASRYLLAVLPPGLRELFRIELEQFTKFYKFKGKV